MAYDGFYRGQEVWVITGLYKGRKGRITWLDKDAAEVSFNLQGDEVTIKVYKTSISPAPPFSKAVPLPPQFFERMEGREIRVRLEGKEIRHEHVEVGDIIRVTLESGSDGYSQTTEGKVANINKKIGSVDPEDFRFTTRVGGFHQLPLNYRSKSEKITLIKKAESPYVSIIKELTAGTTVVRENPNGSVSTYVKAPDWAGSSQWHVMNSFLRGSSSFVTDDDMVRILDDGAEFVHKARK